MHTYSMYPSKPPTWTVYDPAGDEIRNFKREEDAIRFTNILNGGGGLDSYDLIWLKRLTDGELDG